MPAILTRKGKALCCRFGSSTPTASGASMSRPCAGIPSIAISSLSATAPMTSCASRMAWSAAGHSRIPLTPNFLSLPKLELCALTFTRSTPHCLRLVCMMALSLCSTFASNKIDQSSKARSRRASTQTQYGRYLGRKRTLPRI